MTSPRTRVGQEEGLLLLVAQISPFLLRRMCPALLPGEGDGALEVMICKQLFLLVPVET